MSQWTLFIWRIHHNLEIKLATSVAFCGGWAHEGFRNHHGPRCVRGAIFACSCSMLSFLRSWRPVSPRCTRWCFLEFRPPWCTQLPRLGCQCPVGTSECFGRRLRSHRRRPGCRCCCLCVHSGPSWHGYSLLNRRCMWQSDLQLSSLECSRRKPQTHHTAQQQKVNEIHPWVSIKS